jgi:hypothetical protein
MIEATSGSMQASSSRGVLIGDEMGLGKSAQALAVCQALQAKQQSVRTGNGKLKKCLVGRM